MPTTLPSSSAAIERGYPHLAAIRESIRLLYKQFSPQSVRLFSRSLSPDELSRASDSDVVIWVQSVAGAIVRHLQLPIGCVIVSFRDVGAPGLVELSPEDDYLVSLPPRYRDDRRDIAAILAHEVTHVF